MRILFIGGTRFLGLHMAQEALRRGHEVDVFHRGKAPAGALDGAKLLTGDRMGDLSALAQGEWDAVIDTCGYRPGHIETMADALAGRHGNYVFVSTGSVYAPDIPLGTDESAPRASTAVLDGQDLATVAVNGDTYGALKVLCEDAVYARHARHLVLRPTYIVGPQDYTPRFSYWVQQLAGGGVVEAPGPQDAAVQYIDVRDLARFAVHAVEQGLQGTFNTAAPEPPFSFGDLLAGIAAGVAPPGTQFRWQGVEEVKASGKDYPLWHHGESPGWAAVSSKAARSRGFECRPLRETAADVLAWTRAAA